MNNPSKVIYKKCKDADNFNWMPHSTSDMLEELESLTTRYWNLSQMGYTPQEITKYHNLILNLDPNTSTEDKVLILDEAISRNKE
jgi:hypothetical protein